MRTHRQNATELAQKTLADRNVTLTTSAFNKLVAICQDYLIGFISSDTFIQRAKH